jgi:hypothetical protein
MGLYIYLYLFMCVWTVTKILRQKHSYLSTTLHLVAGKTVGIATHYGLTFWGSNPGGSEILHTRPEPPWDPPSLLYNAFRVSVPRGKAAGACL